MTARLDDPKIIAPEDIDPGHDWSRALRAPGTMNVDFEERINFRRLHDYRLARSRMALRKSDLGSLLTFDNNNIRYITSTAIGEWARDKMCRFALLAGDGDRTCGISALRRLTIGFTRRGLNRPVVMPEWSVFAVLFPPNRD